MPIHVVNKYLMLSFFSFKSLNYFGCIKFIRSKKVSGNIRINYRVFVYGLYMALRRNTRLCW